MTNPYFETSPPLDKRNWDPQSGPPPAQGDVPIPQAQLISPPPATTTVAPLPQGSGYASKGGQVANILTNFLAGWNAGKDKAETKARQKAIDTVQTSRATYDMAAEQWKRMEQDGIDPNNPKTEEEKKRVTQTKGVLTQAWQSYIDTMGKYAIPEPKTGKDGKPQKKGIGQGMKDAMMPQGPHMYPAMALQLLKGMDPLQMAGMSNDEKDAQKVRKTEQKNLDLEVANREREGKEQDQIKILQDQRQAAIEKNDSAAVDKIDQQLAGHGINVKEPIPGQRQLETQKVQVESSAFTKLQQGKSINDLTASEQIAMGVPPVRDPFQGYLAEVGPGKKFKSEYEASKHYLEDEHKAREMGRQPTAYEDERRSVRVVAQHEWEAKGNKGPVPDWMVEEELLTRAKPSPEEKANAKMDGKTIDSFQNRAIGQIVRENKGKEDFLSNFFARDTDSGEWTMRSEKAEPGETHWFGENTYKGPDGESVPASKMAEYETTMRGKIRAHLKRLYPDAPDEKIDQILGKPIYGEDEDVKNPPEEKKTDKTEKSEPRTEGGSAQKKFYDVKLQNGTTVTREMTGDKADALRQQGLTVTEGAAKVPNM